MIDINASCLPTQRVPLLFIGAWCYLFFTQMQAVRLQASRRQPDMHSKDSSSEQQQQSNACKVSRTQKRLTSLGIKDFGMTLQSRKEGKQKGTSVYLQHEAVEQIESTRPWPFPLQETGKPGLAQARHATARDSGPLERSRLRTAQ